MTINEAQPIIHEKYFGDKAIAIACVEGIYYPKGPTSPQQLKKDIEYVDNVFKEYGFDALQTYNGVNPPACRKVKWAVDQLQAGKKIDLERLLAD